MLDIRIVISGLWVATMLVFLLGDILRIYSGDFQKSDLYQKLTQPMMLAISVMMLIPVLLVVSNLVLPTEFNRIANLVGAGFFIILNGIGLPTYPGWYDRFLLVVSMGFNVMVIVYVLNN